ncbi:hypothetical protein [Streptomyces sp. P9-A4]|uniref:hypothetical protein n=1 Tax=Streptomyces sp. P9-A4 TaxID=3072285 RepID=UPI002FC5FF02
MEPEQNPQQPHPAELELMKVRAGMAAGLTFEQSARLQGDTVEALTADAQTLAAELGAANQTPPAPRVGGNRGSDVGGGGGTVAAGAEEYRRKHPKREPRPLPTEEQQRRNPWQTSGYTMGSR